MSVTTVFRVSLMPMISTSSFLLMTPLSTRPVPTVPLPVMEKTSSTGMRKGRSSSRTGVGMYSSTVLMSSAMGVVSSEPASPSMASRALPLTTGMSSPGKS